MDASPMNNADQPESQSLGVALWPSLLCTAAESVEERPELHACI